MTGFDFTFLEREQIEREWANRYQVANNIAAVLPLDIPWIAPDITVALHQPQVRQAIATWLRGDNLAP